MLEPAFKLESLTCIRGYNDQTASEIKLDNRGSITVQ